MNRHPFLSGLLILLTAIAANACPASAQEKHILVFSGPQVLSPTMVTTDGAAFQALRTSEAVMVENALPTLIAAIDTALVRRPDLVLIPGNLTLSGDETSHLQVAALLSTLTEAGIPVCVIPGENDINNPSAASYDGAATLPAAPTSAARFAEIYQDFGYGIASDRDALTLTYACDPIPGLRLIAIGNIPEEGMEDATLQWIIDQADEATAIGKQVFVMSYDPMITHYNDEAGTRIPFVHRNWEPVVQSLMAHGIHLSFAGHRYVPDVATYYPTAERADSLVEVSTSALSAYPSAWRWVTVAEDMTQWQVETHHIREVAGLGDVKAMNGDFLRDHIDALVHTYLTIQWDSISEATSTLAPYAKAVGLDITTPEAMTDIAMKYLRDIFVDVAFIHFDGNEQHNPKSPTIAPAIKAAGEQAVYDYIPLLITRRIVAGIVNKLIEENVVGFVDCVLTDTNQYGTPMAGVIDDLSPLIRIPRPALIYDGIAAPPSDHTTLPASSYYTLDGRLLRSIPQQKGIYLSHGKKYLLR